MARELPYPPRPHPAAWWTLGEEPERVGPSAIAALTALIVPGVLVAMSLARSSLAYGLDLWTPRELLLLALPVSVLIALRLGALLSRLQRRQERRLAATVARGIAMERPPRPRPPRGVSCGQGLLNAAIAGLLFLVTFVITGSLLEWAASAHVLVSAPLALAAGIGAIVLLLHIDRFASVIPRWRVARRWMHRDWEGWTREPGR